MAASSDGSPEGRHSPLRAAQPLRNSFSPSCSAFKPVGLVDHLRKKNTTKKNAESDLDHLTRCLNCVYIEEFAHVVTSRWINNLRAYIARSCHSAFARFCATCTCVTAPTPSGCRRGCKINKYDEGGETTTNRSLSLLPK